MQITDHRGHRDTSGDRSAQEQQHLFIDPRVAPGAFIHYSKLHIIIDGFSIIIFLKKKKHFHMFALLISFVVRSKGEKFTCVPCVFSTLYTYLGSLFFFCLIIIIFPFYRSYIMQRNGTPVDRSGAVDDGLKFGPVEQQPNERKKKETDMEYWRAENFTKGKINIKTNNRDVLLSTVTHTPETFLIPSIFPSHLTIKWFVSHFFFSQLINQNKIKK